METSGEFLREERSTSANKDYMFSEYLCHGLKPETRCYCCSLKAEAACHFGCCDSAFSISWCFSHPDSHQTEENIVIFVFHECMLLLLPGFSHPAPVRCRCPRCYPVTHQPLEDIRQGQEGLLSQQTSASFRVAAKSAISSWLDRTLCMMNYFFTRFACQCFRGLRMQKQPNEFPVLCRLNGLKIALSGAEPLELLEGPFVLPFSLSVFPQLALCCSVSTTVGHWCIHSHNNNRSYVQKSSAPRAHFHGFWLFSW